MRGSGDVTGWAAVRRVRGFYASIVWVPALVASIGGLAAARMPAPPWIAVPIAALILAVLTSAAQAIADQTVLLRFFLFPAAIPRGAGRLRGDRVDGALGPGDRARAP